MAVDETWIHYYEPENKSQSRQWVGPGSPRPKKLKTQPSARKVMATVFWDAKSVIMLDFYPREVQWLECTMQTCRSSLESPYVKNAEVN